MSKQANVKTADHDMLTDVMLQGVAVKTHLDLLRWLQGDIQRYLPHDIFMMVWANTETGSIAVDLCSAIPGVRTSSIRLNNQLIEMLTNLFAAWERHFQQPYCLPCKSTLPLCEGQPVSGPGFASMRSALVHGQINQREKTRCLYVAFSRKQNFSREEENFARLLTPCAHYALQRISPVPGEKTIRDTSRTNQKADSFGLSCREQEIMEWVRAGKTNEIIGRILGISPYTVKNHLKRIYAKLGVSNRAHAVSIVDDRILIVGPVHDSNKKLPPTIARIH